MNEEHYKLFRKLQAVEFVTRDWTVYHRFLLIDHVRKMIRDSGWKYEGIPEHLNQREMHLARFCRVYPRLSGAPDSYSTCRKTGVNS